MSYCNYSHVLFVRTGEKLSADDFSPFADNVSPLAFVPGFGGRQGVRGVQPPGNVTLEFGGSVSLYCVIVYNVL